MLQDRYGIPRRYLTGLMSPWTVKRVAEFDGDRISKFAVVRLMPSKLNQVCVARDRAGRRQPNPGHLLALVGKVDIRRKLEYYGQSDPDAPIPTVAELNAPTQGSWSSSRCSRPRSCTRLLTATQEGNYVGTESVGAIPFQGVVLAHSNEAEWQSFKNNKNNEALIDRICVVNVPYCLRTFEEAEIYKKLLQSANLSSFALRAVDPGLRCRSSACSRG